jgi:hypothetical protein
VSLAYVPVNGETTDIHVWRARYDRAIADRAIDRTEALRGVAPADAKPTPSRLCPWCPWYQAGSVDPARSCPGGTS